MIRDACQRRCSSSRLGVRADVSNPHDAESLIKRAQKWGRIIMMSSIAAQDGGLCQTAM
jgi:NAD(P)-dependent dehydrogenase (short-subunit alcohol dehydrogenase family)